jgi:hypothetical protein
MSDGGIPVIKEKEMKKNEEEEEEEQEEGDAMAQPIVQQESGRCQTDLIYPHSLSVCPSVRLSVCCPSRTPSVPVTKMSRITRLQQHLGDGSKDGQFDVLLPESTEGQRTTGQATQAAE